VVGRYTCSWAEEQEDAILLTGVPLSNAQTTDARRAVMISYKRKIRLIILIISLLALIPRYLGAQPAGSSWPMYRHDSARSGISSSHGSGVAGLGWSYFSGWPIYSSPAIGASERVYVGMERAIYCLNSDSSLSWSFRAGDAVNSSPAISTEGRIYVPSDDGWLYALNSNGSLYWTYRTYSSYPLSASPAIGIDGVIYHCSGARFYALSPQGILCWSYRAYSSFTSPAINNDNGKSYWSATNNNIYALNSNGSFSWSYRAYYSRYDYSASSPSVRTNGSIVAGSENNVIYSLAEAGLLLWSYKTGYDIYSSPAVTTDGSVCIGSDDNRVYFLSGVGALIWSYNAGGDVRSAPAIDSLGTVYVGSYSNRVYAIDSIGVLMWSFVARDDIKYSSASIGSDGTIFIGSIDRNLYAIRASSTSDPTLTPTATPFMFIPFNVRLGHSIQPPTGVLSIFVDVTVRDTIYAGIPCLPYICINAGGIQYFILSGNKIATGMTPFLSNGKRKYFQLYDDIGNFEAANIAFSGLAPGQYRIYGALLDKKGAPIGPIAETILTIE